MHVAASDNSRGICWMIAKVAEAKGIKVTMEDASTPKLKLQDMEDDDYSINYLVCSSDLHPADVHRLIEKLHKGTCFECLALRRFFFSLRCPKA